MSIIKVRISDKGKVRKFLTLIENLDYVQVMNKNTMSSKVDKTTSKDSIFAIAGMWDGRSISTDNLRAKAWPKRK